MEFPLCCRYLIAHFASFEVCVQDVDETLQSVSLHHGMGTLVHGDSEFIGMWLDTPRSPLDWDRTFDSMRERGLEKIRFVDASSHRAREAASSMFTACYDSERASSQAHRVILRSAARFTLLNQLIQKAVARSAPRRRGAPTRRRRTISHQGAAISADAPQLGFMLKEAEKEWFSLAAELGYGTSRGASHTTSVAAE